MGIDQHLFGGDSDGRVLTDRQRIGGLDGFHVVLDCPTIVRLGLGAEQVTQQTHHLSLDVRSGRAGGEGLFGFRDCLGEAIHLPQDLRPRESILSIIRSPTDCLVAGLQRGLPVSSHGQQASAKPMRPRILRVELDRLLQVVDASIRLAVHVGFRPEHERLGIDRFEYDLDDLHRRGARGLARLKRKQHAAFGERLAEHVAQLVGNQHRLDAG